MTRLVLRERPPVRLAADGLLPERLAALDPAAIERLPLRVGNRGEQVGDWFQVKADGNERLVIEGPADRLDRIGASMTAGEIVVSGDAGAYLGIGMSGGRIRVEGAAGYGVATDLSGGTIEVHGDAGPAVGGALPGAAGGMRGGVVLVSGRAAGRVGQRLRRGLVVVAGDAGAACGAEMLAGTIVVGGSLGEATGAGMRRGTIIALGAAPALGPGFVETGVHELVILRLLARELLALGWASFAARLSGLRRFAGDAARRGKGEVFVVAA